MNKSFFSLSFVSLNHHCSQTSSRPTPNLQGIVRGTRLVPSILLGGFLLIVRAISFAIRSRVDNKLSETVRFAIKYFQPLCMPSAGNVSAKQKRERKTKYFQQKNLRKTKTLRKEIVDV